MFPFLVGDIGGTNARFAVVENFSNDGSFHIVNARTLPCADYAELALCLDAYLGGIDNGQRINSACIAVAGPVTGDIIKMTNLAWQFSIQALTKRFQWDRLNIINDFTAQACAVPYIPARDLIIVKAGTTIKNKTIAILGPGTGLGMGILSFVDGQAFPVSGEGGHISLAPTTAEELEVLKILSQHFNYVSAETVLCGPGLVNLYQAVAALKNFSAKKITAAEITQLAISQQDPLCHDTLAMFCSLLGATASNLALISGATGGVYLTGGILPRFSDFLLNSSFAQRFINKGPMSAFVNAIPVYLITANDPALIGAAARHQSLGAA